jgi:hypothetical protein
MTPSGVRVQQEFFCLSLQAGKIDWQQSVIAGIGGEPQAHERLV